MAKHTVSLQESDGLKEYLQYRSAPPAVDEARCTPNDPREDHANPTFCFPCPAVCARSALLRLLCAA